MSSSSSRSSLRSSPLAAKPPQNSIDDLLPYLVASKRSLTTIDQVYRANDLCTSTRLALEVSAITTARTSFLQSGVASQLEVLRQVQQKANNTAQLVRTEFEEVVRRLDDAEKRLRDTLDSLSSTIVESKLRPDDEERRYLLDFVDEGGIEALVGNIKLLGENAGKDLEQFIGWIRKFGYGLKKVGGLLDARGSIRGDSRSPNISNEGRSPIPDILRDMEERAKEMAANLESLVSHFDLCVTAIKHTEGGGDAALKIAGDLPEGVNIGPDAPPAPISEEQKTEMMRVLEEDAGQVEDVVMEMKGHIADMEEMYQRVERYMDLLAKDHESMVVAFTLLEEIGQRLPGYITRNQIFLTQWDEMRADIDERLEELDNAKGFYDGFLRAYDNLIIEIGRRKSHEVKIDKVIQDAMSSLEKLYEDDLFEREAFRKEQGEFLPVDIWPGLLNPPTRFSIGPVDGAVERAPDISKSVIHKAIRRVHGPV
ncbi:MAG: hypothetical protein Q9163_005266 [Psora crenata]